MVEGEGSRNVTSVNHCERDRVTQGPVLVGVPSQYLLSLQLFRRKNRNDRQPARQQPLASDGSSQLSEEERVGFRLDVVGDEARPPFGRELTSHGNRARMVGIVGVEQREDGARI